MAVKFAKLPELLRQDGADNQGVSRSQPRFHDSEGEAQRGLFCGTGRFGQREQHLHC